MTGSIPAEFLNCFLLVLLGAACSWSSQDRGPHAELCATAGVEQHGLRSQSWGTWLSRGPATGSHHEADANGPTSPADGASEATVPSGAEATAAAAAADPG